MLRSTLATILRILNAFGLQPREAISAFVSLPRFVRDARSYRRQHSNGERFHLRLSGLFPCFRDFGDTSGAAQGHYFHQDLHVARRVFSNNPARHIDIGSRVDGFIAHLLSFRNVECVDIRPLNADVPGLNFVRSDATDLAEFENDSLESISTLHAAEHFGLGRYGDPIDPHACFRFMKSLQRVLAPGGRLYFSVPVGRERLEFNAHRVFAPSTILQMFDNLTLISFCAVLDDGHLYPDILPEAVAKSNFACGIFEFTK